MDIGKVLKQLSSCGNLDGYWQNSDLDLQYREPNNLLITDLCTETQAGINILVRVRKTFMKLMMQMQLGRKG